ncbi:MAG: acyl-CoA thioester hydrolase/BAAT C-terminal domain-containing protein [Candidatus Binataceae bacterium]
MQLDPSVVERGPFATIRPDAVHINLSVEMDGHPVADSQLVRRFMKAGDVREEVREDGLVASFFHPAGGPHPGIILLGGSGGGLAEDHPALLASHGYAVLSLGYFAMAGLPRDLMEIPLEYFERAIAWMRRQHAVRADKIAVIGASRGGELALLLGATFSEITAVVAYVPSGVVWPGIGGSAEPRSTWTRGGQPVPFIEPAPQDPSVWNKRPVAMTPWFLESMKNRASAERAAIAVERINGSVLMFSGTDDQMWPSLNLADFAVQRMMERKFPHPYEHVSYAGAGHFIRFPYTPVISEIFHPVVKTPMALGGTAEANHIANLDSWRRCLSFLAKFLS